MPPWLQQICGYLLPPRIRSFWNLVWGNMSPLPRMWTENPWKSQQTATTWTTTPASWFGFVLGFRLWSWLQAQLPHPVAASVALRAEPQGPRHVVAATQPGVLTDADLQRLREAAGSAPPRLAQHERASRTAMTRQADDTLADIEAGVALDDGLPGASGDAVLQKLLLVQTQMLAKLTAGKPRSPLEAALNTGRGRDDGSLTAKGSAARDAYVRLLKDSAVVAEQIRRLAAEELGEDATSPPPSLMRTFVEKRSPVGELRTLALVETFAAHAWEHARLTQNLDLESWSARLIMFADQCAMEGGRTQLSWLLTGLPDPAWGTLVRRRQGLRPFSRLCPSLWLSGNVAYLKEMEWLSTRMSSTSTSDPARDHSKDDAEQEEGRPGKPPRRPRRQPKGSGDS